MKGGLAAIVAPPLALHRCGVRRFAGGLRLDLVVDEESTGEGSIRAAASSRCRTAVIVVEPTQPRAGARRQRTDQRRLRRARRRRRTAAGRSSERTPSRRPPAPSSRSRTGMPPGAGDAPADRRGEPHIGTIEGGMKTSVVPDRCRFSVDLRVAPGRDPDAAAAEVDARGRRCARRSPGGLLDARDRDPRDAVRDATRDGAARRRCAPRTPRSAASPAASRACGRPRTRQPTPTTACRVVYGAGDLADAHRANERVDLAEVVTAARVLLAIMLRVAA